MPANSPVVYKLVDPSDPANEKWIRLLRGIILGPSPQRIDALSPNFISDGNTSYCLRFTSPLYPFAKTRVSKDEEINATQKKPKDAYIFVMNPNPLGKGSYGEVSTVTGSWAIAGDNFEYKIKDTERKRAVKVFESEQYARKESDLSIPVKHLSVKYKPYPVGNRQLFLMRQQPGISLQTLINQAKITPEKFTVRQRLELSIAILEALDSQASQYGLIHSDIKPDNLVVNLGPPVTVSLIDYGLALPTQSSKPKHIVGTNYYMAPELLESRIAAKYGPSGPYKKLKTDQSTDLFSAACTLAELWGDESRNMINNPADRDWQLLQQNLDYPLLGLFTHIPDLDEQEKNGIKEILHSLTRYDQKERMSKQAALTQFRDILAKRVTWEFERLEHYGRKKSFYQLNRKKLFRLINGQENLAPLFTRHPHKRLQHLIDTLGSDIAKLQPQTIRALAQQGLRLERDNTLIARYLKRSNSKATDLLKLIELGAPVPPTVLSDWLTRMVSDENKIEWIEISRLLYANCVDKSQIENVFRSATSRFNYDFYRFFLKEDRKYLPLTCLRILEHRRQVHNVLTSLQSLRQAEPRGLEMPIFDRLIEELDQDLESCFKPDLDNLLEKFKTFLTIRREAEDYQKTDTDRNIFSNQPLPPSIIAQKRLCFKELAIALDEVTAADSSKGIASLEQFIDLQQPRCQDLLYYLKLLDEAYERFSVSEESADFDRMNQTFADAYQLLSQKKPLPEAMSYLLGCIDSYDYIKKNLKRETGNGLKNQANEVYSGLTIDNSKDSYLKLKKIATDLGALCLKPHQRLYKGHSLYADPVYIQEIISSSSPSNRI